MTTSSKKRLRPVPEADTDTLIVVGAAAVLVPFGSIDVAGHGTFGVTISHLSSFALGSLITGLLVIAGPIATLVNGRRRERTR